MPDQPRYDAGALTAHARAPGRAHAASRARLKISLAFLKTV